MSRDWQELAAPQRRGTPPGSMRYFAVLFAVPGVRQLLHAFYAFEAELRDTIGGASHDMAHTRFQWWHDELTRLGDGRPRHPVTIALAPAMMQRPADLARLRELMHAAALDLARNTYADWPELERYCGQCGALQEAIAGALTNPSNPDEAECRFAHRLGAAVRQTEMLRDFGHDLRRGLLYVPLGALTEAGLDPLSVPDHPEDPALLSLLAEWQTRLARELDFLPSLLDARQRRRQAHGLVLAALHRRLLARIRPVGEDAAVRADLPPITRLWTAWRAAVASHRP